MAGEHYCFKIDYNEAARRLGRALVFYRAHPIWESNLLQRARKQNELKKLSDASLATVVGFDPSEPLIDEPLIDEPLIKSRESSPEQEMPE